MNFTQNNVYVFLWTCDVAINCLVFILCFVKAKVRKVIYSKEFIGVQQNRAKY